MGGLTQQDVAALGGYQGPPPASLNSSDLASTGNPLGSTADLEQRANQAPDQLVQALQARQTQDQAGAVGFSDRNAQPGQQQTPQQSNDPFAQILQPMYQRLRQLTPTNPQPIAGGLKGFLTGFLQGGGEALMHHVGMLTPEEQRQNLTQQITAVEGRRESWLNTQSEIAFRQQQLAALQQEGQFRAQQQPLQLTHEGLANQAEQFGLDQARQNAPTIANQIPLDETTARLARIPTKFVGQNLSVDDWKMVNARLQAQGYQKFDTGTDGPQGGIWLMDRGGNKIKQLTSVSESNRATQIAKAQITAAQNNIATPTGQDYGQQIQSLGPKGGIVAGIIEGRQSMPSAFALKTPYWQGIMQAVYQIDPQFSEQRAQLRKSYTVGKQSGEINAINTAMGHVGVLGDSIDAINNGDVRVLNSIANRVGVEIGSTPVTTFNTIVHRVGPELSKAYIGSGGSAGERGADEKDFDPARGPAQLKNNVAITAQLLRSKISSLQNQWDMNRAPGMKSFQDQFVMPEAKRQLDKWAPQQQGGGGQQPGGAFNWSAFPTVKP